MDEIVTVTDDEAAEAMVLLLERSKLVVEGAGAVGVAALLSGKVNAPESGAVCAVLSGGNVDATRLSECIALGETVAGRRVVVSVVMPDRPGALSGLLGVVAAQGANVIDVEHLRRGLTCTSARRRSPSSCRRRGASTRPSSTGDRVGGILEPGSGPRRRAFPRAGSNGAIIG